MFWCLCSVLRCVMGRWGIFLAQAAHTLCLGVKESGQDNTTIFQNDMLSHARQVYCLSLAEGPLPPSDDRPRCSVLPVVHSDHWGGVLRPPISQSRDYTEKVHQLCVCVLTKGVLYRQISPRKRENKYLLHGMMRNCIELSFECKEPN